MCRIQSASRAIDECSRRDSGDEVYPTTAVAGYTPWMEAARVDGAGPSVQMAPDLCVAGCRNEAPPAKRSYPLDAAIFLAVVCGNVCGRRCPGPQASLSGLLGLLHGTLARPRCFQNQSKLSPCEVATVVMDARIITVLNVLRELKSVPMTPTLLDPSPCEGACRSKILQSVGVIFNQCSCRMNGVLALD